MLTFLGNRQDFLTAVWTSFCFFVIHFEPSFRSCDHSPRLQWHTKLWVTKERGAKQSLVHILRLLEFALFAERAMLAPRVSM